MMTSLDRLLHALPTEGCFFCPEQPLSGPGRALALAPHPDDPEAIAVLLRMFARGGWTLDWAIVTSGWSGVEDAFVGPDRAMKGRVREAEQRAAARAFGLPDARLTFLRLPEGEDGHLCATPENRRALCAYLDTVAPEVIALPHGADTNPSHRLVYAWASAWAAVQARRIVVCGNEDPKSRNFQPNLAITFGEATARWKADLLECHRSQSARNQATRGHPFATRILTTNRTAEGYAERFRVECYGAGDGERPGREGGSPLPPGGSRQ